MDRAGIERGPRTHWLHIFRHSIESRHELKIKRERGFEPTPSMMGKWRRLNLKNNRERGLRQINEDFTETVEIKSHSFAILVGFRIK